MKELDEVIIPLYLARKLGVVESGTIVWSVPGANYATVECAVLGYNPQGIETKLVDVDISELQLRVETGYENTGQ